ncbi:hypothetical protein ABZX75_03465 [Streptomyces sp. NPDC003038]
MNVGVYTSALAQLAAVFLLLCLCAALDRRYARRDPVTPSA